MSKIMKKINSERMVGKSLVKLNGINLVPEFKKTSSGKYVPDKSKDFFTIVEQGEHKIGKIKLQAELTGTQKLNIFNETESADGKVTIYVSVWDKYLLEGLKNLNTDKPVNVLLTDCVKNEKGFYNANCQFIEQASFSVKKPWQHAWTHRITLKDKDKTFITTTLKFQRPKRKQSDGTYVEDNSMPYFEIKQFDDEREYANLTTVISLHKKTAEAIFGKDDERLKGATSGDYVTYFPNVTAMGKVLGQLKSLSEYMDKVFVCDMVLTKTDKYYNGFLYSLSFANVKKKEEEEESENTNNNSSVPDFPELPENIEEEKQEKETSISEEKSEFPELPIEETPFEEEIPEIQEEDEEIPDFSSMGM